MDKVTIYTNKQCPYCKTVKQSFTDAGIEYVNKDTTEFQDEYIKITNLTGVPTVPTIEYKNNYLVSGRDFPSPQVLIEILKNFKESDFNDSRQSLERLKTMNFYISQAFSRVEQKLIQIENKLNIEENEHKSTN